MTLPKATSKISNYAITRDSLLSEHDIFVRNQKDKELFRILKEARSLSRTFLNRLKGCEMIGNCSEVRCVLYM